MRNILLMGVSDKIPTKDIYVLKMLFDNASDATMERFGKQANLIEFKSPAIGLVLGMTLGFLGADRFYTGGQL